MKKETSFNEIINVVFKGVAVAMGVAVLVTNIMGVIDTNSQIVLLAIGLFCLAVNALDKE